MPSTAFRWPEVLRALTTDDVGLEDDVTHLGIGLQILRVNVDAAARDGLVNLPHYARDVPVDVDKASAGGARGGGCSCGKLIAPTAEPASEYSIILRTTSPPIRSWASSVEATICGVRITFGRPWSGETNRSALEAGSTGKTSIAAPASFPERIAPASASRSTTVPQRPAPSVPRSRRQRSSPN